MSTMKQFRFTDSEQAVLARAIMTRIAEVRADPDRNLYEQYKLHQLLDKLSNPASRPRQSKGEFSRDADG